MFTQCPQCQAAFRVTAQVLQQARGQVLCGSCQNAFNALDHLTEEPPAVQPPAAGEGQDKALLDTLNRLAGPDEVRIEDTGVEWLVLDEPETTTEQPAPGDATGSMRWLVEDPDAAQAAEDVPRVSDAVPVEIDLDSADTTDHPTLDENAIDPDVVHDEPRYDDNTPLPDDFEEQHDYVPPPRHPLRRASDVQMLEAADHVDAQSELDLSEPGDWTDLLEEVDPDARGDGAATPDARTPAEPAARDATEIPLEIEEELAAIHDELASMPDTAGAANAGAKTTDAGTPGDGPTGGADELHIDDSVEQELSAIHLELAAPPDPAGTETADDDAAAGDELVIDDSVEEELSAIHVELAVMPDAAPVETADTDTADEPVDEEPVDEKSADAEAAPGEAAASEADTFETIEPADADLQIDDSVLEITLHDDVFADDADAAADESGDGPAVPAADRSDDSDAATDGDDALTLAKDPDESVGDTVDDGEPAAAPDEEAVAAEQEPDLADTAGPVPAGEPDAEAAAAGSDRDALAHLETSGEYERAIADAEDAILAERAEADAAAGEPLDLDPDAESPDPESPAADEDGDDAGDSRELDDELDDDIAAMTGNMKIDANILRAMKDEELAAAMTDEDGSPMVETIVMEGDAVSAMLDESRRERDVDAAPDEAADPGSLFDTYMMNRRETDGRGPWSGKAAIIGIVVLLLVLLGQVVHNSREALATSDLFNSTLGPLYRTFGSPVTPNWNIKGWRFETTSGSTGEDDGVLTISSRISNRSEDPLPYPLVHVSLTDRYEEIIGSRVLEPNEYLAANADPSRLVASGDNFTAVITIAAPSPDATGFKLNVCYRVSPGRVRCAIEDFKAP